MREPKYTLTLTYDEIAALGRVLYLQTKKDNEDADLFRDKYPELYNIVIQDLKKGQHLQEIVETALCAPSFEED